MTSSTATGTPLRSFAGPIGAALCVLAAVAVARHEGPERLLVAVFAIGVIPMAIYDLIHHRIPNEIVLGQLLLLVVASTCIDIAEASRVSIRGALGAAAALAMFALVRAARTEQFGLAEVKESIPIGFTLGTFSGITLVFGLAAGLAINGAVALALLRSGRVERDTELPAGPSLAAGALLSLVLMTA